MRNAFPRKQKISFNLTKEQKKKRLLKELEELKENKKYAHRPLILLALEYDDVHKNPKLENRIGYSWPQEYKACRVYRACLYLSDEIIQEAQNNCIIPFTQTDRSSKEKAPSSEYTPILTEEIITKHEIHLSELYQSIANDEDLKQEDKENACNAFQESGFIDSNGNNDCNHTKTAWFKYRNLSKNKKERTTELRKTKSPQLDRLLFDEKPPDQEKIDDLINQIPNHHLKQTVLNELFKKLEASTETEKADRKWILVKHMPIKLRYLIFKALNSKSISDNIEICKNLNLYLCHSKFEFDQNTIELIKKTKNIYSLFLLTFPELQLTLTLNWNNKDLRDLIKNVTNQLGNDENTNAVTDIDLKKNSNVLFNLGEYLISRKELSHFRVIFLAYCNNNIDAQNLKLSFYTKIAGLTDAGLTKKFKCFEDLFNLLNKEKGNENYNSIFLNSKVMKELTTLITPIAQHSIYLGIELSAMLLLSGQIDKAATILNQLKIKLNKKTSSNPGIKKEFDFLISELTAMESKAIKSSSQQLVNFKQVQNNPSQTTSIINQENREAHSTQKNNLFLIKYIKLYNLIKQTKRMEGLLNYFYKLKKCKEMKGSNKDSLIKLIKIRVLVLWTKEFKLSELDLESNGIFEEIRKMDERNKLKDLDNIQENKKSINRYNDNDISEKVNILLNEHRNARSVYFHNTKTYCIFEKLKSDKAEEIKEGLIELRQKMLSTHYALYRNSNKIELSVLSVSPPNQ